MEYNITNRSRFAEVAVKFFTEQKRTLMFATVGYLGLCMVIGIWSGLLGVGWGEGGTAIYIILAGLICMIGASLSFSDLGKKPGRISLLMTPAKAADTFTIRFLVYIPGIVILVSLGYIVGQLFTLLSLGIMFDMWDYPLYNPLKGFCDSPLGATIVAAFLFNETLFLMGSTLWPKKSFIKTAVILAALNIVTSLIATFVVRQIVQSGYTMQVNQNALAWTVFGIYMACSVGMTIFAYHRLKTITVK